MPLIYPRNAYWNTEWEGWNVNGLNAPVKRGKVLPILNYWTLTSFFLQETHLRNDSHARLKCKWIQQIHQSNFTIKARGTAILVRRGVPFKHLSTIADRDGRRVILHSTPITLQNIRSKYWRPGVFRKVLNLIPEISSTNLVVIGGDFNFV